MKPPKAPILAAALLLLTIATTTTLRAQQVQVSSTNRTISVTTTEEAERRADTAVVHFGYQLYAATSTQVTDQAGATSKAIVDAVTKLGIDPTSIESEQQSTSPVEPYQLNNQPGEDRAQRKFQATQSWIVRVAADTAPKALAAAVAAGANQSGNIDWSVADEASLSAEAAGKALRHAREIAEQMASGLGAKLGPLVYASNEAQQLRVLPMMARGAALPVSMSENSAAAKQLSLSAPKVRRSATVSAVFSIE